MSTSFNLDVPWVAALLEILEDGEWHFYQEAIDKAGQVIPANLGWEKGEYYRSYHYTRSGKPVQPRKMGTSVETINSGRRIIMSNLVRLLAKRRILEIKYEDPKAKRKSPVKIKLYEVG